MSKQAKITVSTKTVLLPGGVNSNTAFYQQEGAENIDTAAKLVVHNGQRAGKNRSKFQVKLSCHLPDLRLSNYNDGIASNAKGSAQTAVDIDQIPVATGWNIAEVQFTVPANGAKANRQELVNMLIKALQDSAVSSAVVNMEPISG